MDELIYQYVKGQGWVPTQYEQATFKLENYMVTLIKKTPEPKEQYILGAKGETFANIVDWFQKHNEYQFRSNPRMWFSTRTKKNTPAYFNGYDIYVIKWERIKPPKKPRAPATPRARIRRGR